MNTKSSADSDYIHELILAYLLDHVDAQDSLEGIVQWWLTRQHITFQTAQVKKVLARLVHKDLIVQIGHGDQRDHYRINPARVAEIKKQLEDRI